jgi:hypothetical protein
VPGGFGGPSEGPPSWRGDYVPVLPPELEVLPPAHIVAFIRKHVLIVVSQQ